MTTRTIRRVSKTDYTLTSSHDGFPPAATVLQLRDSYLSRCILLSVPYDLPTYRIFENKIIIMLIF